MPRGLGLTHSLRFGYIGGGIRSAIGTILGDDLISYYDAIEQGGNPQLITNSDDPTGSGWVDAGASTTLGQPDPEGGANAWILTSDGLGTSEHIYHLLTGMDDRVLSVVFAVKATATTTAVTFGIRGSVSSWQANTTTILSGPGSLSGTTLRTVSGLTEGTWTYVKLVLDAEFPSGEDTRIAFFPDVAATTPAEAVVIYRPTVEQGIHDELLYLSEGAVAPAYVTTFTDRSKNEFNELMTTGPIYVADAGDGLPAWYFDGNTVPLGVDYGEVFSRPGYKWTCFLFHTDTAGVAGTISASPVVGEDWFINKNLSDDLRANSGASADTPPMDLNVFHYGRGKFDAADGSIWLNGVIGDSGIAMTEDVSGHVMGAASNLTSSKMLGYIRAVCTAKTALTQDKIDQIDQIFDSYRRGILPAVSRVVAEYNAIGQSGSPQLMKYSDDPSEWLDHFAGAPDNNCSVALSQADPDGGTNAFKLTGTGDNALYKNAIERNGPGKMVVDFKVTTEDGSGTAGFWAWSTDLGDYLSCTGEIISGPGATKDPWGSGNNEVTLTGLQDGVWTHVRCTSVGDIDPTDDILVALRPHDIGPLLPTTESAIFYRPTVRAGMTQGLSDGELHFSGATIPAVVTELTDQGPNGYDQSFGAGLEPLFIADMGDGKPAWWWDGTAESDGVSLGGNVVLPGYRWTCQCFTAGSDTLLKYIESGLGQLAEWPSRSIATTDLHRFDAGGATVDGPAVVEDLFEWTKNLASIDNTSIWVDGVAGDAGAAGSLPLTGIRTGSNFNAGAGTQFIGYLRATKTVMGPLTAAQIATEDARFAGYAGYTVIEPSPPAIPVTVQDILGDALLAYYDAEAQGGTDGVAVSQLTDQGPVGEHATASAGEQALYQDDGGDGSPSWLLDGINDHYLTGAFSTTQPFHIWIVLKATDLAKGNDLAGDSITEGSIKIDITSGRVTISAGTNLQSAAGEALTANVWSWLRATFDGASSEIVVDAGTPTTGDAGSGTPNLIGVGSLSGGPV